MQALMMNKIHKWVKNQINNLFNAFIDERWQTERSKCLARVGQISIGDYNMKTDEEIEQAKKELANLEKWRLVKTFSPFLISLIAIIISIIALIN